MLIYCPGDSLGYVHKIEHRVAGRVSNASLFTEWYANWQHIKRPLEIAGIVVSTAIEHRGLLRWYTC